MKVCECQSRCPRNLLLCWIRGRYKISHNQARGNCELDAVQEPNLFVRIDMSIQRTYGIGPILIDDEAMLPNWVIPGRGSQLPRSVRKFLYSMEPDRSIG